MAHEIQDGSGVFGDSGHEIECVQMAVKLSQRIGGDEDRLVGLQGQAEGAPDMLHPVQVVLHQRGSHPIGCDDHEGQPEGSHPEVRVALLKVKNWWS